MTPQKNTPNPREVPTVSKGHARGLRQTQTSAERLLWSCLRDRQLGGLKFRRQHPVGAYILDFYCPASKLAVEKDGEIHGVFADYDADRTRHVEEFGYRVIRFSNDEVLCRLTRVLKEIMEAAGR